MAVVTKIRAGKGQRLVAYKGLQGLHRKEVGVDGGDDKTLDAGGFCSVPIQTMCLLL